MYMAFVLVQANTNTSLMRSAELCKNVFPTSQADFFRFQIPPPPLILEAGLFETLKRQTSNRSEQLVESTCKIHEVLARVKVKSCVFVARL